MFEIALRQKFRFDTPVGALSVEELWDLPLQATHKRPGAANPNLDDIARGLHAALKHDDNISFVDKDRKSDETAQLKFDIVKHIIDVKIGERDAAAKKAENAKTLQKIMGILAERQDGALKDKSDDDLKALAASLQAA